MIDPDDIEQVRTALRQILAWVDQGKRPTHGDLTAVDWYTLALLPRPDVEEMAGGPLSELSRLTTLRPIAELHEDDGPVLAWRLDEDREVCEPPYVVSSADLELPWEDDDESRWFWTTIPTARTKRAVNSRGAL